MTSLFTGLIQVPILLCITELLTVRKQVNSFEVAFAMSLIQLMSMLIYFWQKDFFFFEVPKESRKLLVLRSLLYTISFAMFIKSMEFLNPVTAVIAH